MAAQIPFPQRVSYKPRAEVAADFRRDHPWLTDGQAAEIADELALRCCGSIEEWDAQVRFSARQREQEAALHAPLAVPPAPESGG